MPTNTKPAAETLTDATIRGYLHCGQLDADGVAICRRALAGDEDARAEIAEWESDRLAAIDE